MKQIITGILRVEASGEFSLEDAKKAFIEILKVAVYHKSGKILFDARNMTGEPNDFDRFLYGAFVAEVTQKLTKEHGIRPQFAYVFNIPLRDPESLGEHVAVNRGMKVKNFEKAEDAFEWLTK